MKTLHLPESVILKEIIRCSEDCYILHTESVFFEGWTFQSATVYMRADVKALAEILRLENPFQTRKIEEVLLNMLNVGEPPRIDIKELTGDSLSLRNSEVIVQGNYKKTSTKNFASLPEIVDVFTKVYTTQLGHYLKIEKEFSKDILEKTFSDFQKTFFLIDRGYAPEMASAMTHTNNPVSAMIYHKIKQQLDPEETIMPTVVSEESMPEEKYSFSEHVPVSNNELPF
ncbi:MAG TPA: hypothetical protein VK766_09015 [Cytophagaceae bacterium]|jgi:hypothetical protein|nr:hypothetical protein [Cytophagaceae bacterium]